MTIKKRSELKPTSICPVCNRLRCPQLRDNCADCLISNKDADLCTVDDNIMRSNRYCNCFMEDETDYPEENVIEYVTKLIDIILSKEQKTKQLLTENIELLNEIYSLRNKK